MMSAWTSSPIGCIAGRWRCARRRSLRHGAHRVRARTRRQDRVAVVKGFGGVNNVFAGVYDGHGGKLRGRTVADFAATVLHAVRGRPPRGVGLTPTAPHCRICSRRWRGLSSCGCTKTRRHGAALALSVLRSAAAWRARAGVACERRAASGAAGDRGRHGDDHRARPILLPQPSRLCNERGADSLCRCRRVRDQRRAHSCPRRPAGRCRLRALWW
jgi:hypothetical protein